MRTITEVTKCDRCGAMIEYVTSDDKLRLFRHTQFNILKREVTCWNRIDTFHLCNDCFKKFEEFLNEYKKK